MFRCESNTISSVGIDSFKDTDSIRLSSEDCKIIEKIIKLQHSDKLLKTDQLVLPLYALAAKSYVDEKSSDMSSLLSRLHSVSEFIEKTALLMETAAALRMALFDQLRGVSFIKSPGLCTDIMFVRIKCGESCEAVAEDNDMSIYEL